MAVNCRKREQQERNSDRKVIFQRFERGKSSYIFPYPPVYREPDTDYICFTADKGVHSNHWRVQWVEKSRQETVGQAGRESLLPMEEAMFELHAEDLEPYLAGYDRRFELSQDQIQMGSVFGENPEENLLVPPSLEDLPMVRLNLDRFEPTADENGNYIWKAPPVYQKGKYKGRPLLLTIGVPVSNQIETIDRCLSHVKPLLDKLDAELVVVDTGSTDGTIEVCRKYGARVYEHPWHDNMSAVRNEAIRHARGLWYMSIDDDEWFEDVDEILRFFQSGAYRKHCCATYIQRNYGDSAGKLFEDHYTPRMAEITPQLHFEGRIHDALVGYGGVICQLMSYAHHYGFVNDQPELRQTKFLRNTPILLQDVHEYPENGRYLFQLANEYMVIEKYDTALGLSAQCLAVTMEKSEDEHRLRGCAAQIIHCLYPLKDERLFVWADYLEEEYHLLAASRAACAWQCASLAAAQEKPAEAVFAYFNRYERWLREYREETDASKEYVFYGKKLLEHPYYIMNMMALGFCFSLKVGEDEKALELLERISLEETENNRSNLLKEGFAAGDAVYGMLCEKLTAVQWEEWSEEILNDAGAVLTWETAGRRMADRLPELLARVSVSAVFSWFADAAAPKHHVVRGCLEKYVLNCVREGRIFDEEMPVQELALCYGVLEKAYAEKRESDLLQAYLMAAGIFMERYYPLELLSDPDNTSLPPQDRAAYLMAVVLADGTADSGNVALLKQALAIYPPFHQEIKDILKGLAA